MHIIVAQSHLAFQSKLRSRGLKVGLQGLAQPSGGQEEQKEAVKVFRDFQELVRVGGSCDILNPCNLCDFLIDS